MNLNLFPYAEVSVSNHAILAQFCKDHNVGLVIVGPEAPLAAGSWRPVTWSLTAGFDLLLEPLTLSSRDRGRPDGGWSPLFRAIGKGGTTWGQQKFLKGLHGASRHPDGPLRLLHRPPGSLQLHPQVSTQEWRLSEGPCFVAALLEWYRCNELDFSVKMFALFRSH